MKKSIALISLISLIGCKKNYEHCSNATITVKNIGSRNIAYSWNSNMLSDTLKPGQSTSKDVGEYNADPNNSTTSTAYFETNGAGYAIKPTSCSTVKEIN
jgi:hypothetical protein